MKAPTHATESSGVGVSAVTPKRKPRQTRQPSDLLAELIHLVNLVPADTNLPKSLMALGEANPEKEVELFAAINSLPHEFATHLREVFELEDWDFGVRRKDVIDEYWLRVDNISRVLDRYEYVRLAREGFARVLERREEIMRRRAKLLRMGRPIVNAAVLEAGSTVTITPKNIVEVRLDDFGKAIQGLDVSSLRRCTVCSKLFIARRVDSVVCTPNSKCAKTQSKRNERANAKLRAQLSADRNAKATENNKKYGLPDKNKRPCSPRL